MNRPYEAEDPHFISEIDRRIPPTKAQIKEITIIFEDFGIKKAIPALPTFAELDIFRRTAINQLLAS